MLAETLTRVVSIVFPNDANHHGTLFGGEGLSLLDKAAFLAASRVSRRVLVTARSERVDFLAPANVGMIIEVEAEVVRIGRRSLDVRCRLYAENITSSDRILCTEGKFTMVAIDRDDPIVPHPTPAIFEKDSAATFTEIILPGETNHYGTLFGGTGLSMMGKAAFIAATRKARDVLVMKATDTIDFQKPVSQGEAVHLRTEIRRVGRTSLTVGVELWGENLLTGEIRCCTRGIFTMVCVDSQGRPKPIAQSTNKPA